MSGPIGGSVDGASDVPPIGVPVAPMATGGGPARASVFVGTFGVTIAAIMFLLVFDTFLARIDSTEASSRAVSEYQDGLRLERAGGAAGLQQAEEHFRTAASMDRQNPSYSLALANVLLIQGQAEDAETLLLAILQREPTDGAANMLMARALVRENRIAEAKAYYHRAVYGRWPGGDGGGGGGGSKQARFELIDLLARTRSRQELLAELLPIQDQSLDSLDLRVHIGQLFLLAGSAARAGDVFRGVLHRRPDDAAAYAGLGESALALGDYRRAQGDLSRAARLAPNDSAVEARLDLVDALLALDPDRRGLKLADRYDRSRQVLQLTAASVGLCRSDSAVHAAVFSADSLLRLPVRHAAAAMNDGVDENLALAQRLWVMRPQSCPVGTTPDERALALLQDRLAQ